MLRQILAAGTRFQVFDAGQGPVVLLVHGFPLDHTMWREQLPLLAQTHRVLAPDLRGFGGSLIADDGETRDILSMEQLADDLAAVLDALRVTEPVIFCGLSMGGYIAWQFWRRHRARIAGLVLCDTRALPDTPDAARGRLQTADTVLREGRAVLARAMVPKLFAASTQRDQPEVIAACRATIEATPATTIAAALRGMAQRADSSEFLATVDVPALLICGAEDAITPLAEMRQMAESMPQARLVEVAGAGHMAPLENPGAVNAALVEFVSSLQAN